MDTLYQLLEWNPVQVGSTFQGGGWMGVGGSEFCDTWSPLLLLYCAGDLNFARLLA